MKNWKKGSVAGCLVLFALAGMREIAVAHARNAQQDQSDQQQAPSQQAPAQAPTAPQTQAPPPLQLPENFVAKFHLGGNAAQIPARFVDNLVFVPAGVNRSQPSLFQLDTAAGASAIDPERAMELGLSDLQMPTLNLSGLDVLFGPLAEKSDKDFDADVGRAYEGTLGNDFLAGMVVEINYARQTMKMFDPASFQYSGTGKAVPVTFAGGLPVIRAKINLTGGKPIEGDFAVDTALDASVVVWSRFAQSHNLKLHRTTPSTTFDIAEGDPALNTRISGFQIGPYVVQQAIGIFPRGNPLRNRDPKLAGEIGGGMLHRFIVTFDFPHQQIIFDGSTAFRSDEFEDMSGLAIVAGGPNLKRFEVKQVWPHTAGAEAKVHPGDVIAGANDEAAADMSLPELRALFRQPGTKCKLLIQRGNQTRTVNLPLKRLLEPAR